MKPVRTPDIRTAGIGTPDIEVRRSARRRRTVSAYREGGRVVVLIPDRFTAAEEREWVPRMVQRVLGADRGRTRSGDAALARRAAELSQRYLDGRARPTSVRWVPAMRTRWASCTPLDGTIRLSRRLLDLPTWVQDYVLVHELAHLIEAGHGPRFWRLVENYPRTERARGFLDGVSAAANLSIDAEDDLDADPDADSDADFNADSDDAVGAGPTEGVG
ncbi:M48 family metallopeptidase [Jatrophihabitans endophyticus]|uniref:M48 metallopeptidase family protein n=1 Tax=Jatrophihabitans endophyticus TaxID=1206085 RepID=UPI0026EFE2CE|nr:M48 family metallopeptidase [Jatrophihabitans endophyticus]